MAHDDHSGTASKSRAELLDAFIGELAGCWLSMMRRLHEVGLCAAVAVGGAAWPTRRLRDALERLRCDHCKASPASAWLADQPIEGGTHGGQGATWRVELDLKPI